MHLLVLLYVDDMIMIIVGANDSKNCELRDALSVHFEMKNLGEVKCFLGLEVEKANERYFVSQRGYSQSLVDRFSIGQSKEMVIPMEFNLKLEKDERKPLRDAKKF